MGKLNSEDLPIHVKHYDAIDGSGHEVLQRLVETGGEVRTGGLSDRMKATHLLGYAVQNDQPVAVGAVKRPAESYVRKVSRCSGYDLDSYHAELGWIFVTPEVRGMHLASRISEALCNEYEGPIFATTRSDNTPMQAILGNLGFKRVGIEYGSVEHPGKKIQLWILRTEMKRIVAIR